MIFLLLFVALQGPAWTATPGGATVGDTVRLVRRVAAAPGVQARLLPLEASGLLQPLGPPQAAYAEGALTVLYTVALFQPGDHAIAMPDPELVYPDGRIETVLGDTARVRVASVLPADDHVPPALPALAPLPRSSPTPVPAVVLACAVVIGAVAWGAARRRPGGIAPQELVAEVPAAAPVDRWMSAGEPRAVAAVVSDQVRRLIESGVPQAGRHLDTEECLEVLRAAEVGWPLRELSELLRALERARFSPAVPSDVVELVEQAEQLTVHLVEPPEP